MTITLGPRTSATITAGARLSHGARTAMVVGASVAVSLVALLLPAWPPGEDMGTTHYMGLLAANQPWNLLLFMGIPVVAAETLAITELVILFKRGASRRLRTVNKYTGILAGFYFLGVFVYLLDNAIVPLTRDGGWRGPADLVAVGFYLAGVIPLYTIMLLETRVVGTRLDATGTMRFHATLVGAFLVVAHVAMIFGMLDPSVMGWEPIHVMPGGGTMPGMTH